MKLSRIALAFALSFSLCHTALAQMHNEVLPKSFALSAHLFPAPVVSALSFDMATAKDLDTRDDKLGYMPKFARSIMTDISLTNSGTWTALPNGDRVWRCLVSAPGALALIPCYDAFFIPQGATLHLYTPQRDEVIGAFTSDNNPADGTYNTGLIHGSECIIEYYEPAAVTGSGRIHINEVGYAYRMVPAHRKSQDFGSSAACEVNVVCPEGDHWQDQKNAVVRILVKTGTNFGWCSGTLMNNVGQDCTPFILSADHCYQDEQNNYTPATTANLNQWLFYFNYESPTCANPASQGSLGTHVLSGCTFKAASLDQGGANGSDFVLLQLNAAVPLAYSPYYAGWSISTAPSGAGVSIHHPNADIKKISTYATPLISTTWQSIPNTHWQVQWAPTISGDGVTEPGSSGSPLFDLNKHVIGTLTGGGSACNFPTINDLYGQVAYHWSSNGNIPGKRLQDWLDPSSTGAVTMDGQYMPCTPTNAFDAGILDIQQAGPLCDHNVTVTTTLVNYGNQQMTQDSLTFVVDGGSPQSLLWNGSLNPLQSTQVSLPAQNFPIGSHTITVISSAPDGNQDMNTANDSKTSTFVVYPTTGQFTFTLQTGDRGSEIYWQVIDANNMVAYSGGPYTNVASGQTITQTWCLPLGCYTFSIFNSAGHGLQGNSVNGTYNIKNSSGTVVAQLQHVAFGTEESTPSFCSSASDGINDIAAMLAGVTIYPNPTTGTLTLTNARELTSLTVTDALGRFIMTTTMHDESTRQIDLTAEESGVYFIRLTSDQGSTTRKVVLTKGR